jgi:hypothetical protein
MGGNGNGIDGIAGQRTAAIRRFHRRCRVRGLYPAIARPRRAGRKYSDQAAARNDNDRRPRPDRSYGARDLQRAERFLASLLHGHPAIATGRPIGSAASRLRGAYAPGWMTAACRCLSSSRKNASPAMRSLNSQRWFFTPSKISA